MGAGKKEKKKSCRNEAGVSGNVWPEQANQGDRREQDDQGEVSNIKFGMSKSSGFQQAQKLVQVDALETLCNTL